MAKKTRSGAVNVFCNTPTGAGIGAFEPKVKFTGKDATGRVLGEYLPGMRYTIRTTELSDLVDQWAAARKVSRI